MFPAVTEYVTEMSPRRYFWWRGAMGKRDV
jgi:hypothetical protein